MNRKKIYLIAGELSGDTHGADLIEAFLAEDPNAELRFMGGDLMQKKGGTLAFHYRDIAIMGFVEVIKNLRKIKNSLKKVRADIEAFQPDHIILIDFPGFNLRLAKQLHGLSTIHYYIAPKAWAWNKKRVNSLRNYCKTVHCILPFEVQFFKKHGVNANYVGNPSKSQVEQYLSIHGKKHEEYIALFPGSRIQEVQRVLPVMLESMKDFPSLSFKISKASNLDVEIYEPYIENEDQLFDNNYELLNGAKAALVTSGTATLETALFGVPQVVCYIANSISYFIAKRLVTIPYISLVNLISDKEIVKELIQSDCTPQKISVELAKILTDEGANKMISEYKNLSSILGQQNSAKTAVRSIFTSS